MNIRNILGLASASLILAACQSESYKIEGTCRNIADGDTLFITNDFYNGTPIDTLIVKEGKFSTEGNADSTFLCMLYSPKNRNINIPFFIEPGKIEISLADSPMMSNVKGTSTNRKWQEMNDTVMNIGIRINRIASEIYTNRPDHEIIKQKEAEINRLTKRFKSVIMNYAEKNISNEFGYFILTYYKDVIPVEAHLALIDKMPKDKQNRPAAKAIREELSRRSNVAEGKIIPDFNMDDMDRTPQSIKKLIGENKITILDFWASWCGPCRQEMPLMQDILNKYSSKGLGIVGISLDENMEAWKNGVNAMKMNWPQLSDLRGWQNSAAQMFGVQSIPFTVVVDTNGKILKKGLRGKELQDYVESCLK
ncbi:TlpA disulfide reductase family protein [Xylanibacter muris]|uniref:AhpC/TSA family protein n=1 Tax=Xylanibacter muris TaxID=2736290 RepID=A0ABX2AJ63_9BACT|nr:TlpA disulfide reductase family protein [Xylanibacter muris]NPD91158.1 AhpC/TSA family protein [Xylanibacter muris]